MKPKSIYIHIPFCTHKCHYCDFTAYVVNGQPVDDYMEALEQEMELTIADSPPAEIDTIFIGGGTPTVLNTKQMQRLIDAIKRYFPHWSSQLEFTVEANPESTNEALLETMIQAGVNRLSFGAQTFQPHLLRGIGRIHGAEEIRQSVALARKVGFSNISLDLMFGLPQQTVIDVKESLNEAIQLQPDHFSCYSLKVEEGTYFHTLYKKDSLPLPSDEEEFAMYEQVRFMLQQAGYQQYEISNFARPHKASRHNSTYWRNEPYYGLGAGAHGYVDERRHANVHSISNYIQLVNQGKRPIQSEHMVCREESMENFMIFGLRFLQGVERWRFQQRYGLAMEERFASQIQELKQRGLLHGDRDRLRLTDQGLYFGNEVFASFLG